MLFTSPDILALCKKYAQAAVYETPSVVRLATDKKCESERQYLEALYREMPPFKRNNWFHRFASADREQFWGAWFELMLFGWLKTFGKIQQELGDGQPDFILTLDTNREILIEAKTVLESKINWIEEKFVAKIFTFLREIELPYIVRVGRFVVAENDAFDKRKFVKDVGGWLSTTPEQKFNWSDRYGNMVNLILMSKTSSNQVHGVRWSELPRDIGMLKNALAKKAKQHRLQRKKKQPYVICLFLQSNSYLPRHVVEAWLGASIIKVNRVTGEIIHTSDNSGIHYLGERIVHTTVSGTLVFLQKFDNGLGRRDLDVYWIENPFSDEEIKLKDFVFSVVNSFVVKDRESDFVNMHWLKDE